MRNGDPQGSGNLRQGTRVISLESDLFTGIEVEELSRVLRERRGGRAERMWWRKRLESRQPEETSQRQ